MAIEESSRSIELEVRPGARGEINIFGEWGDAGSGVVVDVEPVVSIPIVGCPPEEFPLAGEGVGVLQVDVAPRVGRLGARIVEHRAEGCRGNMFGSGIQHGMDGEIAANHVGKNAIGLIGVRIDGDAVIGGWRVERLEEELLLAQAIVETARITGIRGCCSIGAHS